MSYERRIYQHIIPALGGTQLDKLTTADIQDFYASLKKGGRLIRAELYGEGLSDQTVCGIHTTLHVALNKAVEENLIFRNPSDGCKLPSAKPREMKVLTPEEIQRLLIQAREDGCYELLLLELSTGLRRGEICAQSLGWPENCAPPSPSPECTQSLSKLLHFPVDGSHHQSRRTPLWTQPPFGSGSRQYWNGQTVKGSASMIYAILSPLPPWSAAWM